MTQLTKLKSKISKMTKKGKTVWVVNYTKFIGGLGQMEVIALNEHEAICNAINQCHTGKNFYITIKN